MSEDQQVSEAELRLQELIEIGLTARGTGLELGPWTEADYDELQIIAQLLGRRLPAKFHSVVNLDYEGLSDSQLSRAQRLERALKVDRKFGRPDDTSISGTSELTPVFELKEQEKKRVLRLTSQMRSIVFSSQIFDEPHKRRLLNRIAAMEKEIHQPKGKLDVILAGVSDVGDTLRKFGGDLKPLTDRMREVKNIAQTNSKEYAQIPPPDEQKKLPAPSEEAGDVET